MFEYFIDNYAWNLSLALSTAMGGQMSEIDIACRPLLGVADRPGSDAGGEAWFQNWMRIAEHVDRLGSADQEAGSVTSGAAKRFRAASYYLIAERNMPWSDPRRSHAYGRAASAFASAAASRGFEHVEVPYRDGT